MYRFEITDDLGRTLSYPLTGTGVVLIGRNDTNNIVLPEKSVSRNHCRLLLNGESIQIEDLGSANGVMVRGVRIQRPTPVTLGDEVIIGENRFFLREGAKGLDVTQPFIHLPPDAENE